MNRNLIRHSFWATLMLIFGCVSTVDARYLRKPLAVEDLYFQMGVGWSQGDYQGRESQYIESGELNLPAGTRTIEDSHDSRFQFSADVAGMYWPLRNWKTMIGGVINLSSDFYSGGEVSSSDHLYHFTFGLSGQHFLLNYIGKGPFLRADAGLAYLMFLPGDSNTELTTKAGVGYGIGGGWAFPLSVRERVTLTGLYTQRNYERLSFSAYQIMITALW